MLEDEQLNSSNACRPFGPKCLCRSRHLLPRHGGQHHLPPPVEQIWQVEIVDKRCDSCWSPKTATQRSISPVGTLMRRRRGRIVQESLGDLRSSAALLLQL